ncbi:hypothetical protein FF32_09985 [Halomonas campaniensis]|uniref:hypothetical protein n=1 Tax=Halomonas sp. IOP_6 TaxID=2876583 RepID=UPI000499CB59|nr:hypothetical protein [Halomonas sp. IOP_6]AIA75162.1 hypothetical protein FF32_09985 [Halomonas campaniensis]MCD6004098.1 hypothetical protein [Halomonas sp. IOP_6]
MNSKAFVELALHILQCNQKQLAGLLGVSPTQITKWKNGEHISLVMQKKFRELTNIGELDPSDVLLCGSVENCMKWKILIQNLAELAREGAETGYYTQPLEDDLDLLLGSTLNTLTDMGVTIPKEFPKGLNESFINEDDDEPKFREYSLASLIYDMYSSLNSVYGFYAAYIDHIINDDRLDLYSSPAENIEPCLLSLAATKVKVDQELAPNFNKFRHEVISDYEKWMLIVKEAAFQGRVPLKAELMDMVYGSPNELDHSAEAESLGVNVAQLHPDIYMNELLVGMRTIHQVLPAILKKLDIEKEFELDISELSVNSRARKNS